MLIKDSGGVRLGVRNLSKQRREWEAGGAVGGGAVGGLVSHKGGFHLKNSNA